MTYHRARNAPESLWARFPCRSLWPNWPCFSRSPFCTRFTLERTDQVREGLSLALKGCTRGKVLLKARLLHRMISWVKCLWLHREVWCQQGRLSLLVAGELHWACTAGFSPLHIATNSESEFGFYKLPVITWKVPHSVRHKRLTFKL